jgi:hypothetical protein
MISKCDFDKFAGIDNFPGFTDYVFESYGDTLKFEFKDLIHPHLGNIVVSVNRDIMFCRDLKEVFRLSILLVDEAENEYDN